MRAIAGAMGFPPALWFEDIPAQAVLRAEGRDVAGRVEHLFETVKYPGPASHTPTPKLPA